jgi:hypothetical protein
MAVDPAMLAQQNPATMGMAGRAATPPTMPLQGAPAPKPKRKKSKKKGVRVMARGHKGHKKSRRGKRK